MVDIDAKDDDTWVNVCHILKTKDPKNHALETDF